MYYFGPNIFVDESRSHFYNWLQLLIFLDRIVTIKYLNLLSNYIKLSSYSQNQFKFLIKNSSIKNLPVKILHLKKKLQIFSAVISHFEMSTGQRRTIPSLRSHQHIKCQASLVHFLFNKTPVRPTFSYPNIQKGVLSIFF